MRILLAQDSDWVMRNPAQQHHLLERMISRGHEVRVIDYDILWKDRSRRGLLSKREIFHVSKVVEGVNITVIRPSLLRIRYFEYLSMLFTYSREIRRQMGEFNPDIVIGNSILSNFLLMRQAHRKGIPYVFSLVDAEHTLVPSKWLKSTGKMIESRLLRRANLTIVINETLREYAVAMGAARSRTTVIRAGIDSKRYNPEVDGNNIRSEYGIDQRDKVLLFMGWLYRFSGLSEAFKGMASLDRENVKLLVVGDGEAYEELKSVRMNLKLETRVIMTGKQPFHRIPEFIAASDVCLLPAQINETMRHIVPIKVYEYMSVARPVVSTRLPGVVAEFGEGNGVVYVDSPDRVISRALELIDSGTASEEGLRARRFVENLSWDSIVNEFESALEYLVAEWNHMPSKIPTY
jgi:glycosyltransferase involved in cell wall biosynthesis